MAGVRGRLVRMEFQEVVRRRRMVRRYDSQRAVPTEVVEELVLEAPVVIIPCANKDAYLERYARPDKGFTDRSDAWWPAPYWDIDTGFTALLVLLTAVDRGLGACFFGLPIERVDAFRQAFGVPSHFRPIGAISIGYPAEPARDLGDRRRPEQELVHRGRWDA
jgi:nitroreductase